MERYLSEDVMSTQVPTLLEHAGRRIEPASLQGGAVVIIDAQLEYVDGRLPLDGIDAALEAVAALLARARAAGAPVVHVLQAGRPGGLFDPAGRSYAAAPPAAPRPGEPVLVKPRPNAFAGTDLDFTLRALGRRDLVLAGFMTHMCISATARAALDLGYRTTLVAAATATRDLPDPVAGDVVRAAVVQRAALAALADRFVRVVADAAGLGA
jgi:nicotinamidase-related amidase